MLSANVQWLDEYPVRDMLKRGWIQAGRDRPSRLTALMTFLGVAVAEPKAFQKAVGFRITESAQHKVSLGALAVWLRKGELDAQEVSTADYDEDVFAEALSRMRRMTTQPPAEFIPAMLELCAEAGVAFCMVQELPKSGANGATRWLTDRKALIQMSIRNKWADSSSGSPSSTRRATCSSIERSAGSSFTASMPTRTSRRSKRRPTGSQETS